MDALASLRDPRWTTDQIVKKLLTIFISVILILEIFNFVSIEQIGEAKIKIRDLIENLTPPNDTFVPPSFRDFSTSTVAPPNDAFVPPSFRDFPTSTSTVAPPNDAFVPPSIRDFPTSTHVEES